ncbi:hypothetical protein K3G63_18240 [Hymenobacter sp. HSC-4F20]|uniref:hypothetical protein n=1 Tax=Hymenobacter sp. HSC-4F20 TaxID=2864135 RepID=UPI001C72D0C3|nr:hypothetical protein [Hymenobacter sp. HSC-4F20]MBX0292393.1 hypothetical protein [Hymenobacter sp. HSC-4F20]
MMRSLLSITLGSLFLLGLLVSCQTEEEAQEPDLSCVSVRVLGLSCNGMLLQLDENVNFGNTIMYRDTLRTHVVGTYSELPTGAEPGRKITFALRNPTAQEAASRPCLAIYQRFDVPQMVVESPRCSK